MIAYSLWGGLELDKMRILRPQNQTTEKYKSSECVLGETVKKHVNYEIVNRTTLTGIYRFDVAEGYAKRLIYNTRAICHWRAVTAQ